jgi:hypothetical protein
MLRASGLAWAGVKPGLVSALGSQTPLFGFVRHSDSRNRGEPIFGVMENWHSSLGKRREASPFALRTRPSTNGIWKGFKKRYFSRLTCGLGGLKRTT